MALCDNRATRPTGQLNRKEGYIMDEYERAFWVTIWRDEQGRLMITDQDDSEELDDSESELTEDRVYYDDELGYVHADGSPIRIKE